MTLKEIVPETISFSCIPSSPTQVRVEQEPHLEQRCGRIIHK